MRIVATVILMCAGAGCASKPADKAEQQPTAEAAAPSEGATPAPEEKLGSLPKEAIRSVVRDNMRDIQRCYDSELQSNPGLAGKVVVKFVISKEGKVSTADITETTLNNRAVEHCIVGDVMGWEFDEPENDGIVIVNYPFSFSAP